MAQRHDFTTVEARLFDSKAKGDSHGVDVVGLGAKTNKKIGYTFDNVVDKNGEVISARQILGDLVLVLIDRQFAVVAFQFDLTTIDVHACHFEGQVSAFFLTGRVS